MRVYGEVWAPQKMQAFEVMWVQKARIVCLASPVRLPHLVHLPLIVLLRFDQREVVQVLDHATLP